MQSVLALVSVVSLASLGAILLFISPPVGGGTAGVLVPILFSLSLFLFLISALTLLGISSRKRFITPGNRQRILTMAFREGLLVSALLLAYIWLARLQVLRVWLVLVLAVLVLIIEYYFLTARFRRVKARN